MKSDISNKYVGLVCQRMFWRMGGTWLLLKHQIYFEKDSQHWYHWYHDGVTCIQNLASVGDSSSMEGLPGKYLAAKPTGVNKKGDFLSRGYTSYTVSKASWRSGLSGLKEEETHSFLFKRNKTISGTKLRKLWKYAMTMGMAKHSRKIWKIRI